MSHSHSMDPGITAGTSEHSSSIDSTTSANSKSRRINTESPPESSITDNEPSYVAASSTHYPGYPDDMVTVPAGVADTTPATTDAF